MRQRSAQGAVARARAGRTSRVVPIVALCFTVAGAAFSGCEPDDPAPPATDTDDLGSDAPDQSPDDVDASDAPDHDAQESEVSPQHPCPSWAYPPESERLWGPDDLAPLALRLPTPDGLEVLVTQGNDGDVTHQGDQRFAWDFGVPYGTTAHAAAAGVVTWVEDTQVGAGSGPEWRDLANFVVLDHGGGLFTSYVHLAAGSARVVPGDLVSAGEVLAETGESGQLTGPHLHFQVENVWSESVPARFAGPLGCNLLPSVGQHLVAQTVPLLDAWPLSALPPDTFSEDGVVEVEGLPARLFERGRVFTIKGRATPRVAVEVYFLLMPPEGGAAVFAERFELAPGHRFEGTLDLGAVEPGQYGWALVAGSGGSVRVPRSVRAALLR